MNTKLGSRLCIVFAPHEDDATFGCGGTIQLKRKADVDVFIVCLTDGRNSHLLNFGIKRNPGPHELARQRENEEKKAMQELNVNIDNVIFLGIEDTTLFGHRKEATLRVTQLLEQLKPSEVFVPYIGDKHPDHVATHLIVCDCLNKLAVSPLVYQYFVWAVPNSRISGNLIVVDISSELDAKKAAISQYESQITNRLYPTQRRPVLASEFVSRFYRPEEIFVLGSSTCLRELDKLWLVLKLSFATWFVGFIKRLRYKL